MLDFSMKTQKSNEAERNLTFLLLSLFEQQNKINKLTVSIESAVKSSGLLNVDVLK